MEQIVKSLDLITSSQNFLKSNSLILNKYWIEPRINNYSLNNNTSISSNTQIILDQIINHIQLIDEELGKIIIQLKQSIIFVLVLQTSTWDELEKLFMEILNKFNFIFGIPHEYTQPIIEWIDSSNMMEMANQFIQEFKRVFGYKFLDLLDERTLEQFFKVLSHVKKLYLIHS